MVCLPKSWSLALDAVIQDPGIVMVLGASDTGKTTWVRTAARESFRSRAAVPLAIVDGDVGQASVGPPATVALGLLRDAPASEWSLHDLPVHALSFIGAVSPLGHLLPLLVGVKRLADKALRLGAAMVLVDTTGLIETGAGFQLKLRKVDLLAPQHLVVLRRGDELDPLLAVLRGRPGLTIHALEAAASARLRQPAERARYRAERFAAYFTGATTLRLETSRLTILSSPGGRLAGDPRFPLLSPTRLQEDGFAGTLVGLNDAANETLGIGLLQGLDDGAKEIRLLTPVAEAGAVRILQMGSLRLHPSGEEV